MARPVLSGRELSSIICVASSSSELELLWLYLPGCGREKTAPSSWLSIVKRCGRDTVVCIVDANNIDGHPIRKIVVKAFIRQKLRGPVTWQADNAHYSGKQAGWQWCYTYNLTEEYKLWNDDKASVIATPCDDNIE